LALAIVMGVSGYPFAPMLATAGQLPVGPGWAFELKWDGVRAIAVTGESGTRLFSRSGAEITQGYPELLRTPGPLVTGPRPAALASVPGAVSTHDASTVLDGELVVFDASGRPSFETLAQRLGVRDPERVGRLAATDPVTYLVFDLLRSGGRSYLDTPYQDRRALLVRLTCAAGVLIPPAFEDGPATLAASREHGLEGVVAKRLASRYRPGVRSPDWIKFKFERESDFVVGGWRPGARELGALLIGVPDPRGTLDYRGRVGGGISVASGWELLAALRRIVTGDSPFGSTVPSEVARSAIWVRPEIVVEVRYGSRTRDNRLRFPRLLRVRPDKPAGEVVDD
jgi:bifunctional non-homologous end joining protein LigD